MNECERADQILEGFLAVIASLQIPFVKTFSQLQPNPFKLAFYK